MSSAVPIVDSPAGRGPTPPPELSGTFGPYEIIRLLGRGGMGAVYLARQASLDRNIVIKVVLGGDDEEAVKRFQREATTAAKIVSDNVVPVYETGVAEGLPYIAMEFVDGLSAAELVNKRGRLPWAEATEIVIAAARGLVAAHAIGVLHRDVKPANILVAKDGRVKVADFGLAKRLPRDATMADPSLTSSGIIIGSPFYMSPEQAENKPLDGRADVYSLGATYFELLTGRPPFQGDSAVKVLSLVLTAPTPSPRDTVPSLPAAVERACLRLLARDREKRPRSMEEAIELLERLEPKRSRGVAGVPPTMPPGDRGAAWTGPVRSTKAPSEGAGVQHVLGMLVAFGLLVGVGVFGVKAMNRRTPPPKRPAPVAAQTLPADDPNAPRVPEPPTPEATARAEVQALYTKCCKDLMEGEHASVEKHATEALERNPTEEHVVQARLLVARGSARMFQERFADAERDFRDAEALDADRQVEARFASFCGALLARDEDLTDRRFHQLPATSIWNQSALELKDAAATRRQPTREFLPFDGPVPNGVYARTLERLILRKR